MVPIRGEVLLDGKPLSDGTVLYLPKAQGGRQARGAISKDGSFRLTTLREDDGAQVGEYNIVVIAYEAHPGEPTREEVEAAGGLIKRGFAVPEKYNKSGNIRFCRFCNEESTTEFIRLELETTE